MLNDEQLDQLEPVAKQASRWMPAIGGTTEVALLSIAISLRRIADALGSPGGDTMSGNCET